MMKFLRYVLNYRKNVLRIEQLRNNLRSAGIFGDEKFILKMARAASQDLWNEFRN